MSQPDSILTAELRAARPLSSPELRARVLALAAEAPGAPPPRRLRLRMLAPVVLGLALAAAVAGGIVGSFSTPTRTAQPQAPVLRAATGGGAGDQARTMAPKSAAAPGVVHGGVAQVAPSRTRAQAYEAEIRLRVTDLSRATKQALRLTSGFGGYVRSVDYGSGPAAGTAELVVRIPIGSVQAALLKFSALGAILEQHVAIQDVQPTFDARFRQLQALRAQIATVQKQLAAPSLTVDVRRTLETRLAALRARLVSLERLQAQARKRVSFATVSLSLTSRAPAAAPPPKPGRLQRALDHAGSILLRELVVLVYLAVVGVPLALLLLVLVTGERLRRRRATDRLLATRRA